MTEDFRTRPRRRGEALENAILGAVVEILDEWGYGDLTFEAVAQRAGTGKASIYRRWPTRVQLARAAAHRLLTDEAGPPDTGSLRGDLKAWIRVTADLLEGPLGEALRGAAAEALTPSSTTEGGLSALSGGWFAGNLDAILERARRRGEPVPRPTDLVRSTPGTLLRFHFLTYGAPIDNAVIDAIVDEVAMPLFTHRMG